jgi:hypothetical protein
MSFQSVGNHLRGYTVPQLKKTTFLDGMYFLRVTSLKMALVVHVHEMPKLHSSA